MMIATHNEQSTPTEDLSIPPLLKDQQALKENGKEALAAQKNLQAVLLPGRFVNHAPQAGVNPLVDAASHLFSILGKLKHLETCSQLAQLQKELIQDVTAFQEALRHQRYQMEYLIIARYVLCATFDDIISNTSWGGQGEWDSFSLLAAFNQDVQHQHKFFTILERALKESTLYIDLMEFIYLCLNAGYKGAYRDTEHNQFLLEQITHTLYKHITVYRGGFNKSLSLSPASLFPRPTKLSKKSPYLSLRFIFFTTASLVMIVFISLGYLMDIISNETYEYISQIQHFISPSR